jgi:hypothetical protein
MLVEPFYLMEKLQVPAFLMEIPRIALVESWFHDMDAGWTRYLFDTYRIPYSVLRPVDLKEANLSRDFDIVILPDQSQSVLMAGKGGRPGIISIPRYPPEYARGMEKEGLNNLLVFCRQWGQDHIMGKIDRHFHGEPEY